MDNQNKNYQMIMETEIESIKKLGSKPILLMQCCCAPCSSAVLERLKEYFKIKMYFYNPNIYPTDEYEKRGKQFNILLSSELLPNDIEIIPSAYKPEEFENTVRGLENEKEGGARCEKCFELRLFNTAKKAKEIRADYFCTTLTVSPHKNSELINKIGIKAEKKYKVKFLQSDFKKKDGYKRSTELSKELGLYRQNYCGCKYSMWFDK
ncbi:MAG: epoxyqueuosine reductase QueH [Clostridia bacterium]|nr:epoxyqueuosine reductase QueH [Clostridia bacterium]